MDSRCPSSTIHFISQIHNKSQEETWISAFVTHVVFFDKFYAPAAQDGQRRRQSCRPKSQSGQIILTIDTSSFDTQTEDSAVKKEIFVSRRDPKDAENIPFLKISAFFVPLREIKCCLGGVPACRAQSLEFLARIYSSNRIVRRGKTGETRAA